MSLLGGAIAGALAVIALDAAVQSSNAATALGVLPKMAAWLIDPATPAIPNIANFGGAPAPAPIPITVTPGGGSAQCPAGYTYDPKSKTCVSNLKPGSLGSPRLA